MTTKKPHPVMPVHNVQLETFEKACYSRNYEEAGKLLLENLRKFKAGAEFVGYSVDPGTKAILYTRFCAAVFALMADTSFHLSQEGFDAIAGEHAIMDVLFRCSTFGTSDHMLPQVSSDPTEKDQTKIKISDSPGLAKYMLTYSLRSGFLMNFKEAFGKNPQAMFNLYIGMLTTMLALTKTAEDRREALLGMHELFEDVELTERMISAMSDAYMYCSYSHRRDKHAIKGLIHDLYAKMMVSHGFKQPKFKPCKGKPTMLIPVEWFTSLHAMYRCYAPFIRQLRTKFKLIGIGRPHATDEESRKEFDGYIELPEDNIVLEEIVRQIKLVAPDIIYYPSLGMDLIWVALSSVRLAPIQVMTLGHPASSWSKVIDYVICEEGEVGDRSLFTEKIIELPRGAMFHFVARPDAEFPEPLVEEAPAVIKIAIPAMLLKLNATFLSTLKEIGEKSKRPVEFHFWPNMIGTMMYQTARELREWLPGAFTYERSPYNQYMRQVQACHIQLGTFPFGGANSNLDAMLLGRPLVCMTGQEPHERCDARMLRAAGLPEWLIAHDREEYVDAALRLIECDTERIMLSRYLLEEATIKGKFLSGAPKEFETAFVDAVWKIWEEQK